jgi:hypothetical protein
MKLVIISRKLYLVNSVGMMSAYEEVEVRLSTFLISALAEVFVSVSHQWLHSEAEASRRLGCPQPVWTKFLQIYLFMCTS